MTKGLDLKIKKLKELEEKISDLIVLKDALRKEIFTFVEKENLDQYKVDGVATISRVVRKVVKFLIPQEEVVAKLKANGLVKYLEEIPAVPATTCLNAKFMEDVKNKEIFVKDVDVIESVGPMIRFEK